MEAGSVIENRLLSKYTKIYLKYVTLARGWLKKPEFKIKCFIAKYKITKLFIVDSTKFRQVTSVTFLYLISVCVKVITFHNKT